MCWCVSHLRTLFYFKYYGDREAINKLHCINYTNTNHRLNWTELIYTGNGNSQGKTMLNEDEASF